MVKVVRKSSRRRRTRHNTKDSVFTHLFSIPKYQLALYRTLHPEDVEVTAKEIETITRECVVAQHEHNDLGILVRDTLLIFVEAQSSWTVNILLRLISYAIHSLMDYFRERDINLHGDGKVNCPRMEFYVIYCGERESVPEQLSFREVFFPNGERCDLDANVRVIAFQEGKADIINQYISFCRVFNEQLKLHGYAPETIQETLRICRDKRILAEYIKQRENEIMDIMTYLCDQKNATRLYGLEQRKAGKVEGIIEGKIEEKNAIARSLLMLQVDIQTIIKATGLTEAEIMKLQNGDS